MHWTGRRWEEEPVADVINAVRVGLIEFQRIELLAGADEDPDGVQDEMAARMPHGRSEHLPGCGHVGAFLRPDEVAAAALPVLQAAAA